MTLRPATFALLASTLFAASTQAQPPAADKPKPVDATQCAKANTCVEQTFYLNSVSQSNDSNEISSALRNMLPSDVKVFLVSSRGAILIQATPEQLTLAHALLLDLDRPRKVYKVTYTIFELEAGKRVSTQHFSVAAKDGERVTLKQGSKVPIITGSGSKENPGATQVQYLDIGMNFDTTLSSTATGGVLKSKVEQSSVAEEKSGVGPQDPVVRQTSLEGTSVLTLGKPLMLGSIDVPGSTRHLDIEVLMELVP